MNWEKYEEEIFNHFEVTYPECDVLKNVHRIGRYSKVDRQIDILIEGRVAGSRVKIVIDGKYFSKKLNVKHIESFIAMLQDIGAEKGILITQKGYSEAAIQRAHNDPNEIELDILNFDDLKKLQGFSAVPYAGKKSFLLPSPFGWIIDINHNEGCLCTLYQRGLTLKKAQKLGEWAYINFWNKIKDPQNLDEHLKWNEEKIKSAFPKAEIEYIAGIKRDNFDSKIRIVDIESYPSLEVTGFIEFEETIFFCVLFTRKELMTKNLRKLEFILSKVEPADITFNNNPLIEQLKSKLKKEKEPEKQATISHKIGHYYEEMEQFKDALDYYKKSNNFLDNYWSLKKEIELELRNNDDYFEEGRIETFFHLDPTNPQIYNDLSNIFLEFGKPDPLIEFFENKLKKVHDNLVLGNINFYLGTLKLNLGKDKQAKKHFEIARDQLKKSLDKDHDVFKDINQILKSF